jgi:hemerythrin
MSLIKWTDDFVTGIGAIDEQHRQLVDIVNRFDEALRKDRGPRTLNGILDDLLGYTQEHFADE